MQTPDNFRRYYNPLYHYVLFAVVLAAFIFRLEWQLPILIILVIVTVISTDRKRIYRGFLKFVSPLIFIGFVINGVFFTGKALFSIGPVSFKTAGLLFATYVAVRLVLIVLSTSGYFAMVKAEVVSEYLVARGADRRFVYIFLLSVAMVHLMRDKMQKIYIAQAARGLDTTKNFVSRLRYLLPMIVPLSYSYIAESLDRGTALRAANFASRRPIHIQSEGPTSLFIIEVDKTGLIIGRMVLVTVVLIGFFGLIKWL